MQVFDKISYSYFEITVQIIHYLVINIFFLVHVSYP